MAIRFASQLLLKKRDIRELLKYRELTDEVIAGYAEKIRIHPGIIVGMLQHRKILSHSEGNHLKVKIELFSFKD